MTTGPSKKRMLQYAEHLIRLPRTKIKPLPLSLQATQEPTSLLPAIRAVQKWADTHPIEVIIAEWINDPILLQQTIHLANQLNICSIFIHNPILAPPRHIIVATAGGPNVIEQMWVAKNLATSFACPVRLIHWGNQQQPSTDNLTASFEQASIHLLDMDDATFETCQGRDFLSCVQAEAQEHDLLIMGAPSPLRLASGFTDSIPDQVVQQRAGTTILLSTPPTNRVHVRRLFWGDLLLPNQQAETATDAIHLVVDNLVRHHQLPETGRDEIIQRVLQREKRTPTVADCQTAFPHIAVEGFHDIAASMAIFPEGVHFGSPDGERTHFICLFLTSEELYDEYLTALAHMAKHMIKAETRKALLTCKTSGEALNVLEPVPRD